MAQRVGNTATPEWEQLFTGFAHSAFRLETLQHYTEPDEAEAFARFQRGQDPQVDLSWWLALAREHTAAGHTMARVRVIVEPPSDYTRFELDAFPAMAAAGDDIRIISTTPGAWPAGIPRRDFWLFDDRDVWLLDYDTSGRLHGADLIDDDQAVNQYRQWRDIALAQSLPVRDYITATGHRAS